MTHPRTTYSGVSIFLHWTIALMAVAQIILISLHDKAAEGDRTWIVGHASVGMTILVLTLVRLAGRLTEPWIPMPVDTPRWQKLLARTTHVGFYLVLLAMPLAGWAAFSAFGRPIEWFGLFELPMLPMPQSRDLGRDIMEMHELAAKLLYVLIGLHVLGALKHQFVDRDNEVRKMLPVIPDRGYVDHRGPDGAP